ncbi:FAD-dependent oxidoreductase [Streptomyces decoyicus]
MNDHTYNVLVCGAGVAGLASARALSDLGLRVLVIDRQRTPQDTAKGEVLQPAALRVLRRWGAEHLLRERGAVQLGQLVVREADGSAAMTLDYGCLPVGDQQLLVHDYRAILTALTDSLGPRAEIRRGTLVREALRDDTGRVTGLRLDQQGHTWEVHAPLVVGADGVASRLRRAAGIGGRHTTYPHRLVALEFAVPSGRPEEFSAYRTLRGLRLVYPKPGNRTRVYLQADPHELRHLDREQLVQWATRALAEVPPLRRMVPLVPAAVTGRQLFTVGNFVAERLVAPGMVLVGEAAYAVHPMAAQGMSSAITSAAALADQIARQLGDPAPGSSRARAAPLRAEAAMVDEALTAYQADRVPVLALSAKTSANAARLVTNLSWPAWWVGHRALRHTAANPRLARAVTRNMAGVSPHPLSTLDRLRQLGLFPDASRPAPLGWLR